METDERFLKPGDITNDGSVVMSMYEQECFSMMIAEARQRIKEEKAD
jgi:hypothetical protein